MKPLLLILDDWEDRLKASACWAGLREQVELCFAEKPMAELEQELLDRVVHLVAIRERTALTKEVFASMPALKLLLQTGGHGYHIDTEAARSRGITIALGRGAKAPLNSVPELTFAMMLALIHKVPQADRAMRNGQWPSMMGRTLAGKTLGILGLGRHGARVAQIAATAFNMDVVAWERPGGSADSKDGYKRLPLEELLSTSDAVSIHLRLSKQSEGLLSRDMLGLMKPGAILINTSRGAIVDEDALTNALKSGALAGAGLDVFVQEPLDGDSPLRRLDNVLLTPHIGWTVEEVFEEFAQIACRQLTSYLKGTLSEGELLSAH